MNGYQIIMNNSISNLSKILGCSERQARNIKTMTRAELNRCEDICPEVMTGIDYKANCREKMYCCYDCRKEFLDEEIQNWSEDIDS